MINRAIGVHDCEGDLSKINQDDMLQYQLLPKWKEWCIGQ